MAKKKSKKRRRSSGGPAGKPGSATKAQAAQRQKSPGAQKGTKGGAKKKAAAKGSDTAGRRSLVDVAKGTSQRQRVTISVIVVVLAAVGGYFGGHSKASNTFRYSYETNAIDAVADGGDAGEPVEVTLGSVTGDNDLTLCVTPDDENPTTGAC
ncbi:MAG: hypothetical protein M5U31_09555 [Acidimicrobiia bacterium]|nr:hypothetical protein [Acidimicrobiia bacterium]